MRRVRRTVMIGICAGILLLLLQRGSGMDESVFMRGYWIAAPFIVIGAALFNILYYLLFMLRMHRLELLLKESSASEYIAATEALLQKAKGKTLRGILKLNLSAGYLEAEEYETALRMLEELSAERLRGREVKLVHGINLCIAYFKTAQYERAKESFLSHRELFEKFREHRRYGGNIAELEILSMMAEGQYETAEALLKTARERWHDARLQAEFQELEELLREKSRDLRSEIQLSGGSENSGRSE